MRLDLTAVIVSTAVLSAQSAYALVHHFKAVMDGSQQVPPSPTKGTGLAYFDFDTATSQLSIVSGTYTNMAGTVVSAHVHQGAAGATGPVIVAMAPAGATTGTLSMAPATLAAPQAAALQSTGLYVNIHSLSFPNGEVRGQIRRIADANDDGLINIDDLLGVINAWGTCANCGPVNCPADVTGNCTVDIDDLLLVITNWD